MKSEEYKFNWFDWFCLWYPPGWLILFNRHWQHYHDDPDGWNWLEYGLFLIPGGFYLALLIRWLRLGCRFPHRENYQFNPNYQQAFGNEIIAPIVQYYFRGQLEQLENLPETGPLIVVLNHAGMCFPWDFLTLAYLLNKTRGWSVQLLGGVSLFDHPWVVWWLPPGWSKALGGVRAEADDFEAAVAQKTILLYAPEGIRGPGKGWRSRYQLDTFHPSFIRLSDRYNIPILPIVCIGNEFLHPWAINLSKISRKLGLPFFPLSLLILIFSLFPSMGVWAMRSHLCYYTQPLFKPDLAATLSSEESLKEKSSLERSTSYQQAELLRQKMQAEIDKLLIK